MKLNEIRSLVTMRRPVVSQVDLNDTADALSRHRPDPRLQRQRPPRCRMNELTMSRGLDSHGHITQQFHDGVIVREMATVLSHFAELIIQ